MAVAAVIAMSVGGVGLLIDHSWLVGKRDLLKSAADSAAVAATLALDKLPKSMSDSAVRARLEPVARRYAYFNVSTNVRDPELRPEDMDVTLTINRGTGIVAVAVEADIGFVLTGWLHDYIGPGRMHQRSGVERGTAPVAIALTIDTSYSMRSDLQGNDVAHYSPSSRLSIVQEAAKELVAILGPNPRDPVSIGLVPWNMHVCHAHDSCAGHESTVVEPSTSAAVVRSAIDDLRLRGGGTYSAGGMRAAMDLLAPVPEQIHKAIVLLTDGEDNLWRPGGTHVCGTYDHDSRRWVFDFDDPRCLGPRREACADAKADGIEVFVVVAMAPEHVSGRLERELRACATTDAESHVFLNNATPADLAEAFQRIGKQLTPLRRIY